MLQQACFRHLFVMPVSFFLGGSVAPILMMLSPFAVMAIGDCAHWTPAARVVKIAPQAGADIHCPPPRPALM